MVVIPQAPLASNLLHRTGHACGTAACARDASMSTQQSQYHRIYGSPRLIITLGTPPSLPLSCACAPSPDVPRAAHRSCARSPLSPTARAHELSPARPPSRVARPPARPTPPHVARRHGGRAAARPPRTASSVEPPSDRPGLPARRVGPRSATAHLSSAFHTRGRLPLPVSASPGRPFRQAACCCGRGRQVC